MKNIGKNPGTIKKLFALAVIGAVISGCTIEPVQSDRDAGIKGAPAWVNKGSMLVHRDGLRIFIGVSSAPPQGDMALQRSIADDNSITEVANTLSSYLDVISNDFMDADRSSDNGVSDVRSSRQVKDAVSQQIEENATININEIVTHQINNAIARQFKDTISKQLKEDIFRQVKKESLRGIKEAVWSQIEFSRELEEAIARQIKESVSRQIKSIIKPSMSGAKLITSWRDPGTNLIWSVSELDMKNVKGAMAGAVDLNLNLKRYFDTNADIIFDRIIDERNNTTNPFFYK